MTARRPGRSRLRPDVDETAVVRRRVHLGWGVKRLAAHYHLSAATVRAILDRHGVPPAPVRGQLDEDAVLAAYARHESLHYVAYAMGVGCAAIEAVLDRNGVKRPATGPGPPTISRRPIPARDGPAGTRRAAAPP